MTKDTTPPVADDDFPEFSGPPRQKPRAEPKAPTGRPGGSAQGEVDDVIERLRRERAERNGS